MTQTQRDLPMGRMEFIALMAMMLATIAFSIDAMLPAMDDVAAELSPDAPTRAALIVTSFFIGMGIGTFFAGPLSDAFGRKPVILWGAALYSLAAAVAWASQSLELMLVARLVQGIGASGPRVVSVAIIRDVYSGREMARILSIVMMIFTLVPGLAPAMGAVIIDAAGWRSIFLAFILFSLVTVLWMGFRLPETLPQPARRPLRLPLIVDAMREMFSSPSVRLSIIVQAIVMAMLISVLVLVQPVYSVVFDKAESFPYWFGAIALFSASASLINAVLVVRLGMRLLIRTALVIQIVISTAVLGATLALDTPSFALFAIWQAYVFFQIGLTVGNLNAIAMEPMGHIAGLAASIVGAVSTLGAAALASPVIFLFNNTIVPLILSVLVLAVVALALMFRLAQVEASEATA